MLIEEENECRGAGAIIEILQFLKFIDLQIRFVDLYSHAFLSFIVARATGVEIIQSIECSMGIIFCFRISIYFVLVVIYFACTSGE